MRQGFKILLVNLLIFIQGNGVVIYVNKDGGFEALWIRSLCGKGSTTRGQILKCSVIEELAINGGSSEIWPQLLIAKLKCLFHV